MRSLLALALVALPGAADPCTADAMLVVDGSASMAEIGLDAGPVPRIVEARAAMARILPQVEDVRRIGLLTYGPGPEGSCEGIRLRFPPMDQAADRALAELETLEPAGLTPLTAAVEAAVAALDHRRAPAVVVLVTDGNETCGGRPCALGDRLAGEAADLRVHVIGFRATRNFFAWDNPEADDLPDDIVARCLADRTGGVFVTALTEDELVTALRRTLGCPLTGALHRAIPHRPS